MCLPSGDQVALETRAFGGTWMTFLVPPAAAMIWMPVLLRMVRARARFALKSMNTPPSSWNGFENTFIGTGPSPISSRNHALSRLALARVSLRYRGARTAVASSDGGAA